MIAGERGKARTILPNVPAAPVGCSTCGAVAGERCKSTSGFAARLHAQRVRDALAYYEGAPAITTGNEVVSMLEYRVRKAARGA